MNIQQTPNIRPRQILPIGKTIGILGSGQLGKMLALAATTLGFKIHIYSAVPPPTPATEIAHYVTYAKYDDTIALTQFATSVDVVTYETENLPYTTLEFLASHIPVFPHINALKMAQDRLMEKQFMNKHGLPTVEFYNITNFETLTTSLDKLHGEAILKTRRLGYDGKGQWYINTDNAQQIFDILDNKPAILESIIPFEKEISVIATQGQTGEIEIFDIVENHHQQHILYTSTAPANITSHINDTAIEIVQKILKSLHYIGVLTVEMFVLEEKILINEIAPRVHNSGHWTQDACYTGQFEQHIRSITGWSLGCPKRHHNAIMTNLIGTEIEKWRRYMDDKHTKIYIYGKNKNREGRKMGHVTKLYPLNTKTLPQ